MESRQDAKSSQVPATVDERVQTYSGGAFNMSRSQSKASFTKRLGENHCAACLHLSPVLVLIVLLFHCAQCAS